jgi:hypothetical protein
MAKFDWFPYLEGKYLTYYQWFAFLGSTALFLLAFLSIVVYLALCKIKFHEQEYSRSSTIFKSIIEGLKHIFFNATFVILSLIPLICAGLDATYFAVGFVGMCVILILLAILNNGRRRWDL